MKSFIIVFLSFLVFSMDSKASLIYKTAADTPLVYVKREPKIKLAKPPVLILMHGLGSNEKDLFGLAPQVPDSFLVISLRAPYTYTQDGYAWYSVEFKGNQIIGNEPEMQKSKEKSIKFIDELIAKKQIDPKKVYLGGFSQGAIMSYEIALCKPEKVKGIIVLGGRLPDGISTRIAKKEEIQKLKVFIAHGTEDKRIDFKKAEEANELLKSLGLKPSFNKYACGHSIPNQMWFDAMKWLK